MKMQNKSEYRKKKIKKNKWELLRIRFLQFTVIIIIGVMIWVSLQFYKMKVSADNAKMSGKYGIYHSSMNRINKG
jgi:hypothetical protein